MTEIVELKQAIAAQENLRAALGDAVVDATIAALREKVAALEAQRLGEQRKQVTVLFADVSGFTAMSESLDAEEVTEIMNALWARLDAAITSHGGRIDKHIGDAVMALWGVQAAREDDPECAIRAALAMQQAISAFVGATPVVAQAEHKAAPLQMRIGINTGPVMLGAVGTTAEFTAMGDTVNLASRLEHTAPIGGILISHETYRHVRGIFNVTPQPLLTVKGKREPIQTYVVQRAKPRAFRMATRGVEGIETRTVGREAELLGLQKAFHDAMDAVRPQTRVVTIVGEAGVGKSRLLYEFDNWIELLPESILYFKGRAYPELANTPYSVLRDLFCYRFDIRESDSAATVREKFEEGVGAYLDAERAHLAGHLVGFDLAATTAVRNLIGSESFGTLALADLTNYFRGITADKQTVIFVEDMHWADNASLDFIVHLASELPERRLLIVCLARPMLFEHRPYWGEGQAAFACVDLEPLSKRASHALVDEILQHVEAIPDALRDLIVDGTEGNPFYVEELIKMLIEDGVIVRGDDERRWRVELERLKQVRVPPTLTGVLQARLDSLPHAEKELLQRASVVGRQFWDLTVATLSQAQLDAIRSTLDAIRARELVFRRERSAFAEAREYIFKHALLRDVTYETVLLKLRRVYHARVARWLETHAGERIGEYAGLIAEHLERAGEAEQAASYLRLAGEKALAAGAFREALAFSRRAVALLPAGSREGAWLFVLAGKALIGLSDYATAHEQLERGLAMAQQSGDESICVDAFDYLGAIAREQGDWTLARAHLEMSLALARKIDDRAKVAHILLGLGAVDIRQGVYSEAMVHLSESHELYQALSDRHRLAQVLNAQGQAAHLLGEYEQARALYLESLAQSRRGGNHASEAVALTNLGETARLQEDYVAAQHYYREALDIFREVGRKAGIAVATGNLGHLASAQGDYATAVRYYHESLQVAMNILSIPFVLESLAGWAGVLARTGQPERASELVGLALSHSALHSDTRRYVVEQALAGLRIQLSPEQVEAGLARGQMLKLEEAAKEMLAEFQAKES